LCTVTAERCDLATGLDIADGAVTFDRVVARVRRADRRIGHAGIAV
jgi:hypothetical protein